MKLCVEEFELKLCNNVVNDNQILEELLMSLVLNFFFCFEKKDTNVVFMNNIYKTYSTM